MKASELRVGNKLYSGNQIVTVKQLILEDTDILICEEHGLFTLGYTVQPIPLTPEILEKCGFENKKEGILFELLTGQIKLNLVFVNLVDSSYFITAVSGPFGMFHFPHQRHLHQLQNLFHALTGEELNYQP